MFKNKDEAAGYLAGLIDGEGHIAFYYHKGAQRSRHICITNTDLSILEGCAEACDLLDLTFNIKDYSYGKKGKKEYRLLIYGHINCKIVLEQVPIRCQYKKNKLEEVVSSFKRSRERRKQGKRSFADVKEVVGSNVYH